jgi:hypothetical protein
MTRAFIAVSAVFSLALTSLPAPAPARQPSAGSSSNGEAIMRRVNARTRGLDSRMRLDMTIHDTKRGDFHKTIIMQRKRLPSGYRTTYWITAPDHEKGIGLLLSEDAVQRGMWMYFPGSRQLLHVATRGLAALASDFTCEDLLVEVPLADYDFQVLGRDEVDHTPAIRVAMTPRTERLRSELGFSRSIGWVRDDIWLIARAEYYDENGDVFKRFHATDVAQVDGVWTVRTFTMDNVRARHGTDVRVAEVTYAVTLPQAAFTPGRLADGLPAQDASSPP